MSDGTNSATGGRDEKENTIGLKMGAIQERRKVYEKKQNVT